MTGRRALWFGLAGLWLSAGLLQAQPRMFSGQFVTSVLLPVAQGQPAWLGSWLAIGRALWQREMALANTGALLLQLLIGVLLLTGWRRPWGRPALALSILWGLGVWVFGEGLGMLLMGAPTVMSGAPGSVLVYVVGTGLLLLPERWWASGAVLRWTMRCLGVFWLLGALAQAWPRSSYWTAPVYRSRPPSPGRSPLSSLRPPAPAGRGEYPPSGCASAGGWARTSAPCSAV